MKTKSKQAKELTIRQFMLKTFPTNEFIDCPISKEIWPYFDKYADLKMKSLLSENETLKQSLSELTAENERLKRKAQKWDNLGQMIAKCYVSYDEKDIEIPAQKPNADLLDIGEMAAIAFGYM